MPKPTFPKEELIEEGRLLRAAIESSAVKMSQEDCMDRLGLAQGNLSQWLQGKTRISDSNLVWLADLYNFDALSIRPSLSRYRDYFIKRGLLSSLTPDNQDRIMGIIKSLESPGTISTKISARSRVPAGKDNK